jgi:hypothetical protein
MKPRQAVALALVGWYLMTPPFRDGKALYNAPIADWDHEWGGSTEEECRKRVEILSRDADIMEKGGLV